MKNSIYSLFDRKSGAFGALLFFVNDDLARRECHAVVAANDSNMARYPDDFDMYRLGDFDTDLGIITPIDRVLVCRLSDFVGLGRNRNIEVTDELLDQLNGGHAVNSSAEVQ